MSVQYSLHAKITFNINLVGKKSVGKSSLATREIKDIFGAVPKASEGF
jgi:GTPase SAR1 family protein